MQKLTFIICLLCIVGARDCFSQDHEKIAQLKKEIASLPNDTVKIRKLISLANKLGNSQFKEAITFSQRALALSDSLVFINGRVEAYNSMADAYWFHSDYEKAQQHYFKAYRISDSLQNKAAIAYSLYNIGWIVCIQQHNYKDDKYLYQSLAIYQSLKDTSGLLKIYNALASYYSDRLATEEKRIYFDSAMRYFNAGLKAATHLNMKSDIGRLYGNMGDLYFNNREYVKARYYNNLSLEIHRDLKDSSSMMICLVNMAAGDLKENRVDTAIRIYNVVSDYNIRHEIKDLQLITLKGLAEAWYLKKDYKKAYDYIEKYVELKDMVDREAYSTSISNLQGSYSLEKAEASVKELLQANEIQELKNKKNTYFIIALLGVALVVIVVAVLLFRQNKQKQLINNQLKFQNTVIAEKKQEIDNSIQYAKGIQQAILPAISELKDKFPQSFVFYKPKDVVSGDFYWFTQVENDFYCIAADCTGHGVPGALMSIIGADKISQAIFEKHISSPGAILSFLNTQIKQVLKQHTDQSKQKDGMDIALLKFSITNSQLQYAGANRPLCLIRDGALIEYKPEKAAIAGFTPDEQVYTTTTVELKKNDCIYIFTDGYADQFGGTEGKKFMSKNLKQLLLSVCDKPAALQQELLVQAFNNWKQDYEQVDDVLLIGIKI